MMPCWKLRKLASAKIGTRWFDLKPADFIPKNPTKFGFIYVFVDIVPFSVDNVIFYPSLGVDRLGSAFPEPVLFSHPEICKRLKRRLHTMSRRGRRLKPSVGGGPVMSPLQKIQKNSFLVQITCKISKDSTSNSILCQRCQRKAGSGALCTLWGVWP